MKNENKITVEVCCGGVEDAVRAYEAGADRIELNAALSAGGLTPSAGMLARVLDSVDIPVICMIRPREGGFCYSKSELDTMLSDAEYFVRAGAAGAAFGFLTADGKIDAARTALMVKALCGREAVFHRAFDGTSSSREQALEALIGAGVTRVLTSGRRPTSLEGAEELAACVKCAAGRIQILPGGGVRPFNAKQILDASGCTQLHFTCHSSSYDRSCAGNPLLSFDSVAPEQPCLVRRVDSDKLKNFIAQLKG